MKLQFSATQDYQLKAVESVVSIFEGQPLAESDFEVSLGGGGGSLSFTETGVGNRLHLAEAQILENIQTVQRRNGLPLSEKVEPCIYVKEGETLEMDGTTTHDGTQRMDGKKRGAIRLNFTVEMETGTGKTYTFLRTIYELNKVYGFKKFVIVVPSVAIREGGLKNLQITHEHFQTLYDNPPVNYVVYDRDNLAALRNFATSNAIQILVINIDSFTKDSNVINTQREQGIKPIEYIQATNPIVIVDEPQNFETDVRKAALHNLNPLCTIRYSATHRNFYNLVYSLNPVQAYDLGLVKQIEVDGIEMAADTNEAYIKLLGFDRGKKTIKVTLELHKQSLFDVKEAKVKAQIGDDLHDLSGQNPIYKDGYIINSIDTQAEKIEFSNGLILSLYEETGQKDEEIIKYQIERTIHHHFQKEVRYWKALGSYQPIKVISLFFIDKVANYREYDEAGNPQNGKFALWFEEIFEKYANKYKSQYPDLYTPPPPSAYLDSKKVHETDIPVTSPFFMDKTKVHGGYFSSDKKGKLKDTKGNTKDDEDIYSLIMKEKERLLSLEEPLRFIFSHSALREGWDNPNVFQICTLNETRSELKKRQEIGRGLRLPVDSQGERVMDKRISVLTVIANETYEDFAKALQTEIQQETSVDFSGRVKNCKDKAKIQRNSKELNFEDMPLLKEVWDKISHKTRYRVTFSTDELIQKAVAEIQNMPPTKRPILTSKTGTIDLTKEAVEGELKELQIRYAQPKEYTIPDIYAYIQNRVDLTRNTIYEILIQSGRYKELAINPQVFLDNTVAAIIRVLNTLLVDGVKYEQINGKRYEMKLFAAEEIEGYLSNLFAVSKAEKTVFNYIAVDSTVESQFAKSCEADDNVKFFFKLPRGFKIPTPIGNYIPDWAIIMEEEGKNRVYFVAETKGTMDEQLLREVEQMKIQCGKKHFAELKPLGVEYKAPVREHSDLYK